MNPINDRTNTSNVRKLIQLQHEEGGIVHFHNSFGGPKGYAMWDSRGPVLGSDAIRRIGDMNAPVVIAQDDGSHHVL